MQNEYMALKRSESIKKIPEKLLNSLEDKQWDLLNEGFDQAWYRYKQKRFWPFLACLTLGWLILPLLFWVFYRNRLLEWKQFNAIQQEMEVVKSQRDRRDFLKRFWNKKNVLPTENIQETNIFYRSLIQAARQYNMRIDLYDYTLDRQNKKLDPPFTVGELEQIEITFQRVHDELNSALDLLQIAEQHPDMDLISLLKDQYLGTKYSVDYLSQTSNFGESGKLIQELLLVETELRAEIDQLTRPSPFSSN